MCSPYRSGPISPCLKQPVIAEPFGSPFPAGPNTLSIATALFADATERSGRSANRTASNSLDNPRTPLNMSGDRVRSARCIARRAVARRIGNPSMPKPAQRLASMRATLSPRKSRGCGFANSMARIPGLTSTEQMTISPARDTALSNQCLQSSVRAARMPARPASSIKSLRPKTTLALNAPLRTDRSV